MLDCRYYDLCCFTDDSCNGEPECPKRDHCLFYSPMPDVKALLALADELSLSAETGMCVVHSSCLRCPGDDDPDDMLGCYREIANTVARRIREALGVVPDAPLRPVPPMLDFAASVDLTPDGLALFNELLEGGAKLRRGRTGQ